MLFVLHVVFKFWKFKYELLSSINCAILCHWVLSWVLSHFYILYSTLLIHGKFFPLSQFLEHKGGFEMPNMDLTKRKETSVVILV